jgi:hypothetical protein
MRSLLSSLPFSRIGSNPREIGEKEEWWAEEEEEEVESGERFEVDLVFSSFQLLLMSTVC